VVSSDDFDQRFVQAFAIPELRIGSDYGATVSKVLGYLSVYSDLSERTASKILADEMLLAKLSEVDQDSEQYEEALRMAISSDNEQLLAEKESLEASRAAAEERAVELAEQTRQALAETERSRIEAHRARSYLYASLLMLGVVVIAAAPTLTGWTWLETHPHRFGLSICLGVIWVCLVATFAARRFWVVFAGAGIIGAFVGLAQIVDRT
jgi:hypothetical protein